MLHIDDIKKTKKNPQKMQNRKKKHTKKRQKDNSKKWDRRKWLGWEGCGRGQGNKQLICPMF